MTCRLGERRRHTQWCARRPRCGFEAAAAARGVGVMPELGQVPSDPRVGPAATPGPKSYRSTFMCHLLAQRAEDGEVFDALAHFEVESRLHFYFFYLNIFF